MATHRGIVLVEDDPNDVVLLQHAFKKAEITVPIIVLENGQDAVDYLAGAGRFHDRKEFPLPRLVLVDLNLPLIPGLDVLSWINSRKELASLPVVILTSSSNRQDVEESRRRGAQAFFIKPLSNDKRVGLAKFIKQNWLDSRHPSHKKPAEHDTDFIVFISPPRSTTKAAGGAPGNV